MPPIFMPPRFVRRCAVNLACRCPLTPPVMPTYGWSRQRFGVANAWIGHRRPGCCTLYLSRWRERAGRGCRLGARCNDRIGGLGSTLVVAPDRPVRFLRLGPGFLFLVLGNPRRLADIVQMQRTFQQRLRIHARREPADPQVQVRAAGAAGRADLAERLPAPDLVAGLHAERAHVETRADHAIAMIDVDAVAGQEML